MKSISIYYLLITASVFFLVTSCYKTYEPTKIQPPVYTGPPANITIAEFRSKYSEILQLSDSSEITEDYIINAVVIGNDISGNIYNKLYIRDNTGAINICVAQNALFANHRVGQELYLHLKGLSTVVYDGEMHIGYSATDENCIPWEIYKKHVFFNDFPKPKSVKPEIVTIQQIEPNLVNSLVEIRNVSFVNGGISNFTTDKKTTNEIIIDRNDNQLIVRTLPSCNFSNDLLPEGKLTLTGILERFNGIWHLIIRDRNDIKDFNESIDKEPVIFFKETFGSGNYSDDFRPKIADFLWFDMKNPIEYSDPTGNCEVQSVDDLDAHVWFPPNKTSTLIIKNINSLIYFDIKLSFDIAAELTTVNDINLNVMNLSCNGTLFPLPHTPVSNENGDNNKYYSFIFGNIPASDSLMIEFKAAQATNNAGLRLDNVKLIGMEREGGDIIDIYPD